MNKITLLLLPALLFVNIVIAQNPDSITRELKQLQTDNQTISGKMPTIMLLSTAGVPLHGIRINSMEHHYLFTPILTMMT